MLCLTQSKRALKKHCDEAIRHTHIYTQVHNVTHATSNDFKTSKIKKTNTKSDHLN